MRYAIERNNLSSMAYYGYGYAMIKLLRTTIVQTKDGTLLVKINARPHDVGIPISAKMLDNWVARQVRDNLFSSPTTGK